VADESAEESVSELLSAREKTAQSVKLTHLFTVFDYTYANMMLSSKYQNEFPRQDLKAETLQEKLVKLRIQKHGYVCLGTNKIALRA
jgi:hypothetical protein